MFDGIIKTIQDNHPDKNNPGHIYKTDSVFCFWDNNGMRVWQAFKLDHHIIVQHMVINQDGSTHVDYIHMVELGDLEELAIVTEDLIEQIPKLSTYP